MRPPTRLPVAIGLLLAALAGCGTPGATSDPRAGTTVTAQPAITASSSTTTPTTTTSPVTVTHTSVATTTTARGVADPGDLYAVDIASGEIDRLTTDPRLDGAPAWLPNGEQLLFGRLVSGTDLANGNADIFLMAADGTAEHRLTDHPANDLNARPAPDGISIVFTSERDGNPEIYLLVLATGELRRLTNDPASDRYPAFSPDGQTIAFTSDRAGDDDLYLMDAAGSNVRALTDTPGTEWLAEFSPDGATIAFATDHSIDLVNVDGSNRTTLTRNAANHPSWSPEGDRIAAVTLTEQGYFAICIIEVPTGALTVITDAAANDFYPAWSPDGDTIVFTRASSGK
jgi:Tol biopolymer transport system component